MSEVEEIMKRIKSHNRGVQGIVIENSECYLRSSVAFILVLFTVLIACYFAQCANEALMCCSSLFVLACLDMTL